MSTKRSAKTITKKEDIDFLLSLKREDITSSLIMDMFGEFNGSARFQPYDIVTIPKGEYGKGVRPNKNEFTTTVGKLIFNKIFIEARPGILKQIGWWDDTVNKKSYGKLFDKLGYLRLEDDITLDDYVYFCNTTQFVMPFVSILSTGFTDDLLTVSKKINARKEKLLKENKAAIEAGDIKVADAIQKELLDYSKELLKDDPGMDMYDCGAGGDFGNHFKNIFVMKGAVKDPNPAKGYSIITSNLIDGVAADEYKNLANSLAEGPYNRSKKTEVGGAYEKQFIAAYQHICVGEPGSDCGTNRHITIHVTDKNIDSIMYCYIIEGDKLVEITSKNKDKYIGKTVKLRFSSLCKNREICNKCAGNLWYRLGLKNVGVITPQIPSTLKNLAMKSFHDSQVNLKEMDPMKAFGLNP